MGNKIYVLLEERLAQSLLADIQRYKKDLSHEGRDCTIKFIAAHESPQSIRALLRNGYESDGLDGALLVGAIPSLIFNKDGEGDAYWHNHPCDGYYMDLYGRFITRNSTGANTSWEPDPSIDEGIQIWASRVRADTLANTGMGGELGLYRKYFNKIHRYRTGKLALPPRRAFVLWHTIDIIQGEWGTDVQALYGEHNVEVLGHLSKGPEARKYADAYIQALQDEHGYECVALNTVTFATHHDFAGAKITWERLKELKPKRVLWYHMITSEPGRHDHEPYLGGIYLFGDTPTVAMFTGTQHGGAAGKEIYPMLKKGRCFGDACREGLRHILRNLGKKSHYTVAWRDDHKEEYHYTMEMKAPGVLLGDGSLSLPDSMKSHASR